MLEADAGAAGLVGGDELDPGLLEGFTDAEEVFKARPRTYITPKGLKYLAERVPDEVFVTVPPPQGLFKGQEQAQAHN